MNLSSSFKEISLSDMFLITAKIILLVGVKASYSLVSFATFSTLNFEHQ